jgi:3-hydroxyacyl-[acyl-carrier-protein] dehydratase
MTESTILEAGDINFILKTLPHRFPFLLIDRVHSIRGDEFAVGVKNVTANEPQFMGHFPERPVFPGVYMIEGMAQTAGVICIASKGPTAVPSTIFFMTIDKAKFRKPVIPGDTLEYHMTKIAQRKNMWWYRGEARVGGTLVAEAEVSAMLGI